MAFHKNELRKIKIVSTKEKLTMAGGLGTMIELFDQTELKNEFIACLPERSSHQIDPIF